MAREIDMSKPLTAEDIAYLKARHPLAYVRRLIDLAGGVDEASASDTGEEAENSPETGEQGAGEPDASEAGSEAGDGPESNPEGGDDDEDLIGDAGETPFDVLKATEAEVKTWAESASDEAKAAALTTEQAREDRDPRKGVVGLLS